MSDLAEEKWRQAVALREAGFSVPVIVGRLALKGEISVRGLSARFREAQICSRDGTKKVRAEGKKRTSVVTEEQWALLATAKAEGLSLALCAKELGLDVSRQAVFRGLKNRGHEVGKPTKTIARARKPVVPKPAFEPALSREQIGLAVEQVRAGGSYTAVARELTAQSGKRVWALTVQRAVERRGVYSQHQGRPPKIRPVAAKAKTL